MRTRFRVSANDASDRLLPTTTCLTCTRAPGSRPAWSTLAGGCDRRIRRFTTRWIRIGGPCGDEEGCSPSRAVVAAFWAADPDTLSRSTHDFASDASSPLESRLRLRRSVCVVPVGSRPLPPLLVKGTACHDPRRLPSARHLFLARSSSPCVSCDRARVVHPSLASRFAFAREKQEVFDTEVCNLNTDARAKTVVRARCLFPAPDRRPVRVGRLCLAATHPGKPRRSAPSCGTHLAVRQRPFTRCFAFRDRAGSCFEPVPPCHERVRRVAPERCERRRSPPLFHLAPPGSAF
jgi:hypothetical protein